MDIGYSAQYMTTLLLDTDDLEEAQTVLSSAYAAKVQLHQTAKDEPCRARLSRSSVGPLSVDDASFSCDLDYQMEPPRQILLCRLRRGGITGRLPHHRSSERFGVGDVAAFGALEGLPVDCQIHRAQYDVIPVDRRLFNDVAGGSPGGTSREVRLTGGSPISAEANLYMAKAMDYVSNTVAHDSHAQSSAVIAGAVARYLATSMLATFPHTELPEQTDVRRDTTPALLRRAIAFIDDNAHRDIAIADVANHLFLTPRSIQLMFRKYRDCTPTEYLRTVRLHHAHVDLLAGDRMRTTVTEIANRWGFAHVGRFAVVYRQHYGQSPHETLRG
jgi:AraC-like DNA-binding protein